MKSKEGSARHTQEGGQLQGQQKRGQMAHDDRRHESGRAGGEMPMQDHAPDRTSHAKGKHSRKGQDHTG